MLSSIQDKARSLAGSVGQAVQAATQKAGQLVREAGQAAAAIGTGRDDATDVNRLIAVVDGMGGSPDYDGPSADEFAQIAANVLVGKKMPLAQRLGELHVGHNVRVISMDRDVAQLISDQGIPFHMPSLDLMNYYIGYKRDHVIPEVRNHEREGEEMKLAQHGEQAAAWQAFAEPRRAGEFRSGDVLYFEPHGNRAPIYYSVVDVGPGHIDVAQTPWAPTGCRTDELATRRMRLDEFSLETSGGELILMQEAATKV